MTDTGSKAQANRELVYPLDANVSPTATCVRCGANKVQVAVRATNGSKDAICLECVKGGRTPVQRRWACIFCDTQNGAMVRECSYCHAPSFKAKPGPLVRSEAHNHNVAGVDVPCDSMECGYAPVADFDPVCQACGSSDCGGCYSDADGGL